ncbi:MAG: hypothetical protein WBF38_08085 [Nitrosotalea sp.]
MTNEDWIFWNKDHLITWDDFQGETKQSSTHYAQTANKIQYNWKIEFRTDKAKFRFLDFEVKAIFVKSQSWKQKFTAYYPEKVLKHEQGHFDIAEEFSRRFKEILTTELMNKTFSFKMKGNETYENSANAEAKKIVDRVYEKVETEYNNEHHKYDDETKHGTDLRHQEKYDQRFDKLRN